MAKSGHIRQRRFTHNYARVWFDPADNRTFAMTITTTHAAAAAPSARALLPLWVGLGVYTLFLLAGNRLLIDPDTLWQVTVGQWIIDHRAVPTVDVERDPQRLRTAHERILADGPVQVRQHQFWLRAVKR